MSSGRRLQDRLVGSQDVLACMRNLRLGRLLLQDIYETLQNNIDARDVSALSKHDSLRLCSSSCKIPEARRRAARSIANRARLAVRVTPPKRNQEKKKRNYEGYIQKKFTPAIIADVMLKLSNAQSEWVKRASFGPLLGPHACTYQHRLGYKIADAFWSRTCYSIHGFLL